MKKRFSEEQIIGFLREVDAGVPVKELCRKHGFSEASYYLWRNKFGGMEVSDAKRLRALEAENARLKKLLAESMLENEVTREALKKMYDPPRVCKRLLLQRVRLVGLPKCIRPTVGSCKLPGLDGNPRTPGLINGAVYDDRFFRTGSRRVGLTVLPSS